MAIKIDFEKTYDRLSWSFANDTLLDVGLPEHMVNLIMACISSKPLQTRERLKVRGSHLPLHFRSVYGKAFSTYLGCS
ncbi:hypothetical protein TanjilG_31176 [Lupinus angustifolius]|uniref:Reverse transcriptase domain-containing protein n=1 Tax=Lupinus angustifolius TaxID=3871 RepID=A0A394DMM4_LUPAN|nr:hypothetical protein TanjilG_31176 [Lupinus angustifolius]